MHMIYNSSSRVSVSSVGVVLCCSFVGVRCCDGDGGGGGGGDGLLLM